MFESFLFGEAGLGGFASSMHWRPPAGGGAVGELVGRERAIADLRTLAAQWLGAALEPHHRFLVEKTPSHLYAVDFISQVFPEATFVHVLRDGRDVVVSWSAAATGWASWWRPALLDVDTAGLAVRVQLPIGPLYTRARAWRGCVDRMRILGERLGPRLHEVRYEDLRADPLAGTRRLLDFCGMPYDDDLVGRAVEATDLGRLDHGEGKFRGAGRTGDWQRRFGLLERLAFDRAAGGALLATGYERSRLWWLPRRAVGPKPSGTP